MAPVVWVQTDIPATGLTISPDGLSVTASANARHVTSDRGKDGKVFVSHRWGPGPNVGAVGISNGAPIASYCGDSKNAIGCYGGLLCYNSQWSWRFSASDARVEGSVVDIAYDRATGLVWARFNGGLWNNSVAADPAAGMGGFYLPLTGTGPVYAALHVDAGQTYTCNFGAQDYTYAPPAGFVGIDEPAASGASGAASGSIDLSGMATGFAEARGDAAGSLNLGGTATGKASASGEASGAPGIDGSASGQAPAAGSATGTVDLTGSATASAKAAGSAAGSLDISASASGEASARGTASGSISLGGSAAGVTQTDATSGQAAGSIDIGGVATGHAAAVGSSAGQIGLSGLATGDALAAGAAAGAIGLGGSAAGAVTDPLPPPKVVLTRAPGRWRAPETAAGRWSARRAAGVWQRRRVVGEWRAA